MNRKGFTMIELIATLLVLGVVIGITVFGSSTIFSSAKSKTEDVFVGTIRDALDMYLTSKEAKNLNYVSKCSNSLNKSYGKISVYKHNVTLNDVFNSEYKPMELNEFVNPANEDVSCNLNATVTIYRDDDFVYYYRLKKEDLGCLLNVSDTYITNLPEGFVC